MKPSARGGVPLPQHIGGLADHVGYLLELPAERLVLIGPYVSYLHVYTLGWTGLGQPHPRYAAWERAWEPAPER